MKRETHVADDEDELATHSDRHDRGHTLRIVVDMHVDISKDNGVPTVTELQREMSNVPPIGHCCPYTIVEHPLPSVATHTGVGGCVGVAVGAAIGATVGFMDGMGVGTAVGTADGAAVGFADVGASVGDAVVGALVVGDCEGTVVGTCVVGAEVGARDGHVPHKPGHWRAMRLEHGRVMVGAINATQTGSSSMP